MNALVTGGAGFIGRWVVRRLLQMGHRVAVLDNFSSGSPENLAEFTNSPDLEVIEGDICDEVTLRNGFRASTDAVFHLAARINVQHSIDEPSDTFHTDVAGTFAVLEAARQAGASFTLVSTCMVFGPMSDESGLNENSPVLPASPYAGAKLAAEHLAESYSRAYRMPVTVLRPFNTFGPWQRVDGEGGVVAVFLANRLAGMPLNIYGDGKQSRDFLYVEDCADFIVRAGLSPARPFKRLVAGSGREITVNALAGLIAADSVPVRHVPHIHPQSEILRLRCDYRTTAALLDWHPRISLEDGIVRTLAELRKRVHR